MIEQFSAGVPQASQPAAGAPRDRQTAGQQDEKSSDRFEDLVSKTSDRQAKNPQKNQDEDAADGNDVRIGRPVDVMPKAVLELSAALKGLGSKPGATSPQIQLQAQAQLQTQAQAQAQIQARIAGAKEALKAADQKGSQAEVALAKLVEKLKLAAENEKKLDADQIAAADKQPLTPSDELSLLLGLTQDAAAKSGKDAGSAEAGEKTAGKTDKDDDAADAADSRIDTRNGDPMLITVNTRSGGDRPAGDDDKASDQRADVVRVGNGRGRSVDIDVPAVPGTQSQDGAKSAGTPKIETATVLEARRYLGFSTDTNGGALAAAVKADPTWTSALQAAQRADLGTLANTVTEVNTLKLELNPGDLGTMVASLKLKGEELTVELRVNSAEAYRSLTADHDDIVKSLQDQGFSIDKVTVQLNATEKTDTGADRDLARQQQRDGQGDGRTSQREGQGGQPGRDDGARGQPRWTSSGAPVDVGTGDGRSEPGRTGNLYL
ncbi:flagellar hook-length control protein FliK [Rhizobium sp.]